MAAQGVPPCTAFHNASCAHCAQRAGKGEGLATGVAMAAKYTDIDTAVIGRIEFSTGAKTSADGSSVSVQYRVKSLKKKAPAWKLRMCPSSAAALARCKEDLILEVVQLSRRARGVFKTYVALEDAAVATEKRRRGDAQIADPTILLMIAQQVGCEQYESLQLQRLAATPL